MDRFAIGRRVWHSLQHHPPSQSRYLPRAASAQSRFPDKGWPHGPYFYNPHPWIPRFKYKIVDITIQETDRTLRNWLSVGLSILMKALPLGTVSLMKLRGTALGSEWNTVLPRLNALHEIDVDEAVGETLINTLKDDPAGQFLPLLERFHYLWVQEPYQSPLSDILDLRKAKSAQHPAPHSGQYPINMTPREEEIDEADLQDLLKEIRLSRLRRDLA